MAKRVKDVDKRWDYLVDYVNEAALARLPLQGICNRMAKAYKKEPSRNIYRDNANSYYQNNLKNNNILLCEKLKPLCDSIPDATDATVFNAVETFTSMAMGGAGQFLYGASDPYAEKDPDTIDRLCEFYQYIHDDNSVDALMPEAVRHMPLQGQINFYPKFQEGSSTRFDIALINAWEMLSDPRSSRTNRTRYKGFTKIESWAALKEFITEEKGRYIINAVNNVDQYIDAIHGWGSASSGSPWYNELRKDLDTFKAIYHLPATRGSQSKDKKGNIVSPVEPGYNGDDVEVAYIWDMVHRVYAIVINRRFVVKVDEKPLTKTIKTEYIDSEGKTKTRDVEVYIDCPIITVPFIKLPWETYPVSPLFYCGDDFDQICAMESILEHNFSIMAPITFLGTSFDSEQAGKLGSVAGEILEGTMNTMMVMNKTHDMSPILAAIDRKQQSIISMLGTPDQIANQQVFGDRATAAQVGAVNAIVTQRMTPPIANIAAGVSKLMQTMATMLIIFSEEDEFTFPYNGTTGVVSKKDLLGRSLVQAKLRSQIKAEEDQAANKALMLYQTAAAIPGIDQAQLSQLLWPIITRGVISRRQAAGVIQEQLPPALEQTVPAGSGSQLVDQSIMEGMTPEDMAMIVGAAESALQPSQPGMSSTGQEQLPVATGTPPELAGMMANDVTSLV